jgi:hypothetical protein
VSNWDRVFCKGRTTSRMRVIGRNFSLHCRGDTSRSSMSGLLPVGVRSEVSSVLRNRVAKTPLGISNLLEVHLPGISNAHLDESSFREFERVFHFLVGPCSGVSRWSRPRSI